MNKHVITYPFVPKSTSDLMAGHFWPLSFSDGSFGCGRVMQIPPKEMRNRTSFLAGIMDWRSTTPPTYDSIAGARCIDQTRVHVKSIAFIGSFISGYRSLDEDGLEPWYFRGAHCDANSHLHHGMVPIRAQLPEDIGFPVLATFALGGTQHFAEAYLLRGVKPRRANKAFNPTSLPSLHSGKDAG